jgi:UDP-3-O-[3-hydroxymyristoyl] glucosamine N-acyltransferase
MIQSVRIIADLNNYEIIGILDHHYWGNTDTLGGIPYIGDERTLLDKDDKQAQEWLRTCAFFPINWHSGNQPRPGEMDLNLLRQQRIRILEESNADVINLIHPDVIGREDLYHRFATTTLGKGILMQSSTFVAPDDSQIGDYCQIEAGSMISHHVTLGKNVLVAPQCFVGPGAQLTIGNNSYIGAHTNWDFQHDPSIPLTVGENVTVWARSLVRKNIPDNSIHTDGERVFKKRMNNGV